LHGVVKKLLVGFLIFVVIIFVTIIPKSRRRINLEYIQEHEIVSYLRNGDIICRLGDRPWSLLFREISPNDKRFSHLGIVRISGGIISVINAEGLAVEGRGYVNEVSLKEFLKIAQSVGIYRLNGIDGIDGNEISDAALEFKGYPFDWQFDMNENTKLYCSELLYVVLKKISPNIELNCIWLKEIGKYIIPVDVCSQSEYFVEIGFWGKNSKAGKAHNVPAAARSDQRVKIHYPAP
jgi:hypothetical protein